MPKEKKEQSVELMRHLLGSIDLSDIDDKEETEAERADYCAAIFAVFPRLEKDIKKFLHEQLMYSANKAETWEQVIFGRGSFNGIDLLYEHWKIAQAEHIAKSQGKEIPDQTKPFNEV